MNWMILLVAGLLEIVWAVGLKYTDGFTKFWPSAITLVAMLISVVLLGIAMKTIPAGTAYAVWVGIGIVGTVILGMILFAEPVNALRVASIALIVFGVIGLKLSSGE